MSVCLCHSVPAAVPDLSHATEELFVKATYYKKRERALGALNGTLLRVSLRASHKILFWKKGILKNIILIFQNIKKTLKDGSLFAKCKKKTTHYPRAILLKKSYP